VLGLFDRCKSLLAAIGVLLTNDFVHEAVMLGRPLFTDSLMLAEYASAEKARRAELGVGWEMAGLADLEGIYRDASSRGDDVTEQLTALAERRTKIEAYGRRHGVKTRAWRPDEHAKELAIKHGRGDEYPAMLLTHHFVHGSTMAASQRYSAAADGTIEVGGPAAQLEPWAMDAGSTA
jgi:hypothetical protein